MDLCSLDVELTSFPYSVVAAAAICHLRDRQTALAVSGLSWESIAECVQWMAPFHAVILEDGAPLQLLEQNEHVPQNFGLHAVCPNLTKDDSYKVQVHTCNLDMFVSIDWWLERGFVLYCLAHMDMLKPSIRIYLIFLRYNFKRN